MASLLIADDSASTRRLLSRALELAGFDVALAEDGNQALTRIRELSPQLVVLDAQMPHLDGYEVCRQVRADDGLDVQPHIIMLTAGGRETDRQRAEQAGVNEFLTKPFSPSQLVERVAEILGEAP